MLPPPRAPDPPSPWESIMCGNKSNSNGQDRSSWTANKKRPPKVRLREFRVINGKKVRSENADDVDPKWCKNRHVEDWRISRSTTIAQCDFEREYNREVSNAEVILYVAFCRYEEAAPVNCKCIIDGINRRSTGFSLEAFD